MIAEGSALWQYLPPEQRILAGDGEFLIEDSQHHRDEEPTDYSYVVFPFSKLYEGFLKQLFLDLGIIAKTDYYSDHFRIGKVLSPHMVRRLGKHSAYAQIEARFGKELATRLWHTWKNARNLVFHFYPHNYHALGYEQAVTLARNVVETMADAVEKTKVQLHTRPIIGQ